MPPGPAVEPTLGEVVRRLGDLAADMRALRGELVRRDVYDAHRDTATLQIRTIEAQILGIETELRVMGQDRASMRRLVIGAVVTAVLSAVVQVGVALAT